MGLCGWVWGAGGAIRRQRESGGGDGEERGGADYVADEKTRTGKKVSEFSYSVPGMRYKLGDCRRDLQRGE